MNVLNEWNLPRSRQHFPVIPRDKSRQSDNGTRYASCSGDKLTGVFEMLPSALQNWISVQFVAAGHWIGGNGWANSASPWFGGLMLFGESFELFGIGSDFSSSPPTGGKYWPIGLVPCGTSLSRGGIYCCPTYGFFVIIGRGVWTAGATYGRWVLGLGWYVITLTVGVGLCSSCTRQQTSGWKQLEAYRRWMEKGNETKKKKSKTNEETADKEND